MAARDHEAIQQKRTAAQQRKRAIRDQKIAARDQKIAEHKAKVGLREQKKLDTRQHISDTATQMFLDDGFDNVRVADVARACGVSEKTVFNYFPTKEMLVLDHEEPMTQRLRERIGPGAKDSPADAMIDLINNQLEIMIGHGLGTPKMQESVVPFMAMIDSTPSLREARDGIVKRLTDAASESLAERYGRPADDPEIRVTAAALVAFWNVGRTRAFKYGQEGKSVAEIRKLLRKDVKSVSKLLHNGLDGSALGKTSSRK